MPRPLGTNKLRPMVEPLEGRALLSGAAHALTRVAHPVMISQVHSSGIKSSSAGSAAVMNAIFGGMGSEYIKLIQHEVKNLGAVLSSFMGGRLRQYSIPGLTVKTPVVQPEFHGQPYDQLLPTAAGAMVLKSNVVELGAITARSVPRPEHFVLCLRSQSRRGQQVGTDVSRPTRHHA